MTPHRWLLIGLLLAVSPAAAQTPGDAYWLVGQITGHWEYRDGPNGRERQLTGRYDYLLVGGEVRCLEKDVRQCELQYLSNPRSDTTTKLPVPLKQTGQWVRLKGLPAPPPAMLPLTSTQLVQKLTSRTRQGGSRAVSGCEGEFPLRAPACGETVDLSDFRIRWQPDDTATGKILVLVQKMDGNATIFRGASAVSSGEFSGVKLTDYLRGLQSSNEMVDVLVKVSSDYNRGATRLVHIPPLARTQKYEARLKQISTPDPLLRSLAVMSLAMDEQMWSRAAEEASHLVELVSGSPYLLEYVMAGLCQSDYMEAKSEARQYGSEDIYSRICAGAPAPRPAASTATAPAAGTPPAAVPAGNAPPAARPAEKGIGSKMRPGIALLIGNWDYWNTPLNSVREDLKQMKDVFEGLGFAVSVKQNLRTPQDFLDALDKTLAEERATADDILLVYYSGHGVQIDGKSYLLATGVSNKVKTAEETRGEAQSTEQLLAEMETATPGTRILIVEACRDSFLSAPVPAEGRAGKGGVAFRQDDVTNTFVMFANKPGLPTPARSDEGDMGPFTESFIYALHNSTGEIQDVFRIAADKTRELSPGQEPDEHHSRQVEKVFLQAKDAAVQDERAKTLLNEAEPFYTERAWDKFVGKVSRGRAFASNAELQQRLSREVEFGKLASRADAAEADRKWPEAADQWQKAGDLFPARQWATMKAAVAWLLAGDVPAGVRALAVVAARSDADPAPQAKRMLDDLLKSFPTLEVEAAKARQGATRISTGEFETIKDEE